MQAQDVVAAVEDGTIRLKRSARRRKTISVALEGDTFVLSVPASYDLVKEADSVARLITRMEDRARSARRGDADLEALAAALDAAYFDDGIRPASVRWVTNQNTRWGSTTTSARTIRISHRLRHVPEWVLSAVLVHELAHLRVADHGPRFRALTARYPHTARADDFLAGFAAGEAYAHR
ncbi:M48 metallopeptidase family protein [Brevibacterium litoralis]|uniref:M48 metallopeptidase family protein n=1 Tax=Brevibacterium litoralis TaxID=3138935 RepID=UPI0032EE2196